MRTKVYLTGAEKINWAVNDDLKLTKEALADFVDLVDQIEEADVIHAVNWYGLSDQSEALLQKKYIICHLPHDVRYMLAQPSYLHIMPFIDKWIVPSRKAEQYVKLLSLPYAYIPYAINLQKFYPYAKADMHSLTELKGKHNIPNGKYLIGSFQRDTEGKDLRTPKYVKGPDVFFQIVKAIYQETRDIHVLLGGPRRFWLKRKLNEANIPFTFIGEDVDESKDDIEVNILDHSVVNALYNIIDVYVVASRLEGGPKAILECAASKTKIVSTDVGHAPDILDEQQLFKNIAEAKDMILNDIHQNTLSRFTNRSYQISQEHQVNKIVSLFSSLYQTFSLPESMPAQSYKRFRAVSKRKFIFPNHHKASIYFKFHKPPWGGGNQMLLALSKALTSKGWKISNKLRGTFSALLFNSFHINIDEAKKIRTRDKRIIHRIDGPTSLIRGKDEELDQNIFIVNKKVADISVFQSAWSLFKTLELKYKPVNPILIQNGADSEIFNTNGRIAFSNRRKTKLISSSWSDNPRKGESIYQWLDEHLDFDLYEYTFVGRVNGQFNNINVIPPVDSGELANILRQHDIYITASDNDPCSNALIEALSCGLPSIYYNRGGHPEIVGHGGLGFNDKEDIPTLLKMLIKHYTSIQELIVVPPIESIANKYAECFEL